MWNLGRLHRFERRWMGMMDDNPCPKDVSLPQFGLVQVTLPFKIFGGGLTIAFTLLLLEYIAKRFFDTQETVVVRRASIAVAPKKKKRRSNDTADDPPPRPFLH